MSIIYVTCGLCGEKFKVSGDKFSLLNQGIGWRFTEQLEIRGKVVTMQIVSDSVDTDICATCTLKYAIKLMRKILENADTLNNTPAKLHFDNLEEDD